MTEEMIQAQTPARVSHIHFVDAHDRRRLVPVAGLSAMSATKLHMVGDYVVTLKTFNRVVRYLWENGICADLTGNDVVAGDCHTGQ